MDEQLRQVARVYLCFAGLMRIDAEGLGGRMLLAANAGPGAEALVRASSIAGAATLLLCAETRDAIALVRAGVCDFMVTHLDEALRILKNELRRRQPVAVCLLAEPAPTMLACIERGVQPDLIDAPQSVLLDRGARVVSCAPVTTRAADGSALRLVTWAVPHGQGRMLRELDALAIAALGADGLEPGRRWLSLAPQYLARSFSNRRMLLMQADQAQRFQVFVERGADPGAVVVDQFAWPA